MRLLRTVIVLALGLGLGACSAQQPGPGQQGDRSIRLAVARMAAGVDPADDLTSSYLRMYGATEALLKIQPDGSVAPELAERVEQTAPEVWTATLRSGAVFWSGAPVNANAVVASLERSRERSTNAKGMLSGVTISADGDRTVAFRSKGPAPYFNYALAHYSMVIHNAAAYQGRNPTDVSSADLTGPYRLTGFETERSATLQRNERWWGGRTGAPGVQVTLVPDDQSRAEMALSGQADIVESFPGGRAEEARGAGLQIVSQPSASTVAVYLNPASKQAPALADQDVRQALGWGTDRSKVVELATKGLAAPLPSWLASNPGYPKAAKTGFTSFDLDRAKQLLDRAGWTAGSDGMRSKDGKPLSIRLLTFGTEAATGEVLQAQWRALGVDLKVRNVEASLVTQSVKNGDWDAVTQAWTTLGNVPALMDNQIGPQGAANHGRYQVKGVAEAIQQATAAKTAAAREGAVLKVNQLMAESVPSIPVHTRVAAVALAKNVKGFVGHPQQYETIIRGEMTVG
ncbi:MAG: ABC transporter substrate-binding protein [Micropruina sp.]|uniref:ABC transporter substrate-binding protein n=1 Tax=Micropruina sp. TaxID=2737536 RepID=UPI0039E3AF7A